MALTVLSNSEEFCRYKIRINDAFIKKLHAAGELSDEQVLSIPTLPKPDKVDIVLNGMTSLRLDAIIKCLRETSQDLLADVLKGGGVVAKIQVKRSYLSSKKKKKLIKALNALSNQMVPKSEAIWDFLGQMRQTNLEVVGAYQEILWIWCKTKNAFRWVRENISNTRIITELFGLLIAEPVNTSARLVDGKFKVRVIEDRSCPVTSYAHGEKFIFDVCKDGESYLLHQNQIIIQGAFGLNDVIELTKDLTPESLVRCGDSFYVADRNTKKIWAIEKKGSSVKETCWLDAEAPFTIAASCDGQQIIMVKRISAKLESYQVGVAKQLRLCLQVPDFATNPSHAVQLSNKNLVVSYFGGVYMTSEKGELISHIRVFSGSRFYSNPFLSALSLSLAFDTSCLAVGDDDQIYACDEKNGDITVLGPRLFLHTWALRRREKHQL